MTRKTWTLVAAILGSGIVYLDSTIVTVALPRIGRELPVHSFGVLEAQSYVYSGYLLTQSALLILAGALNDFYGRRRVVTIGVASFGVTSALCGLAPSMELLIAFRLLQGAAGALLVPGGLALITATFSGEEQGRAIGLWSGTAAGTTILGPFIGGLLVDTISWRAGFLVNLPVVAVTLWVLRRHVQESRDEEASGKFDIVGTVLTALAIGGLAFGVMYGQQRQWRDPLAFGALAVGGVATLLVPLQMARSSNPLVPLHLFRSRTFTVTNLSTLVIYGALAVTFYSLTLFMQGVLGYTAAAVGLATIPVDLLLAAFSTRFGALAGRYGPRWFMAAGPAIMAIAVLWLARTPTSSQPWMFRPGAPGALLPPSAYVTDFLPAFLIFGIGLMIMVAPLTTALMTSVPVHNAGVASAVNNAIADVGPQLVGALVFVAITASFYANLAAHAPTLDTSSPAVRRQFAPLNPLPAGTPAEESAAARAASTRAFHLAMMVSAGLLAGGAVINAIGIRNPLAPGAPGQDRRLHLAHCGRRIWSAFAKYATGRPRADAPRGERAKGV